MHEIISVVVLFSIPFCFKQVACLTAIDHDLAVLISSCHLLQCYVFRRLSALAGAAQAVKSAITALDTLASGGDDQQGGLVLCTLLSQAAAAVPPQGSPAMQAIEAIEGSLTYPQAPVKVWSHSSCRPSAVESA